MECDYIIVGGGSAGCVLASRLTEDPHVEVVLIEKGSNYNRLALGVPLLGMRMMGSYLQDYWTDPQAHCHGRRVYLPVANAMGGGSSVNAMIYVRGERRAYDRWAAGGAPGWSYDEVLPYFRKLEDFEGGADEYHGAGGPIGVSGTRYKSPFGHAFIEACVERGLARNDDFTGAYQAGAGFFQYTQSNGERSSTALGYLRPAQSRKNLRILSGTTVETIILDGPRAVGVRGRRANRDLSAYAGREIILSAGAVATPKLLLTSGIGPAVELRALSIDVHSDLPAVGKGLQDHPRCPVSYVPRHPVALTLPALAFPFLRWLTARDGIFTSPKLAAGAFLKLSDESELLDCQIAATWTGSPPDRSTIDLYVLMVDVESRGSVRLASADPREDPIIDPNYLSTERELNVMVEAIRFVRALTSAKAYSECDLIRETLPGPHIRSDSELADYVKNSVETAFHPAGTCRMGTDERSVVDPELRVHGLERLRIVDASVMPSLINANTNGPTIMIAEKAADRIRHSAPRS